MKHTKQIFACSILAITLFIKGVSANAPVTEKSPKKTTLTVGSHSIQPFSQNDPQILELNRMFGTMTSFVKKESKEAEDDILAHDESDALICYNRAIAYCENYQRIARYTEDGMQYDNSTAAKAPHNSKLYKAYLKRQIESSYKYRFQFTHDIRYKAGLLSFKLHRYLATLNYLLPIREYIGSGMSNGQYYSAVVISALRMGKSDLAKKLYHEAFKLSNIFPNQMIMFRKHLPADTPIEMEASVLMIRANGEQSDNSPKTVSDVNKALQLVPNNPYLCYLGGETLHYAGFGDTVIPGTSNKIVHAILKRAIDNLNGQTVPGLKALYNQTEYGS